MMARIHEKILGLLLIGSLFSLYTLNFGFCYSPNATIPFSFKELSGYVFVTSPVENFTYSDSSIRVNVSLHIGGIEYEPNTHYVPYQNMSVVYSLDDAEWEEMSLVSVDGHEAFSSLVNPFWYSNTWLNYTAALHDVSGGHHYLRIGIRPENIPLMYDSSQGSLVYFNVIDSGSNNQSSTLPASGSLLTLVTALVLSTVVAGIGLTVVVYLKKRRKGMS